MRISDWSSDVCSSDLEGAKTIDVAFDFLSPTRTSEGRIVVTPAMMNLQWEQVSLYPAGHFTRQIPVQLDVTLPPGWTGAAALDRSEEHTSELQSLMRISYAVFCLKKKKRKYNM